jgi:hypothetical protein
MNKPVVGRPLLSLETRSRQRISARMNRSAVGLHLYLESMYRADIIIGL